MFTAAASSAASLRCAQMPAPANVMTFEQFSAQAYVETQLGLPTGILIVDGDMPVEGPEAMRKLYDQYLNSFREQTANSLFAPRYSTVHIANGADAIWGARDNQRLSYCISNGFASRKPLVVQAMADAAAAWSSAANMKFIYLAGQDATCDGTNNNVTFNVETTSGQRYIARAFLPNFRRDQRVLMIDDYSFGAPFPLTLAGILRHELGHAIGLRHEHTRPEAGTCFEDHQWRSLTSYDAQSVMHYPQCNGTGDWSMALTSFDKTGIAALYGNAMTCQELTAPASHVVLAGLNSTNIGHALTGNGYINVINNGGHIEVSQTGSGTINIINTGMNVTASNFGAGVMTISGSVTAALVVSNAGDGKVTVIAGGSIPLTITHTGDDDFVYPPPL